MVHTATLSYILSKEESELFNAFIRLDGSFFNDNTKKWYNTRLKNKGLVLMCYQKESVGRTLYLFLLRINFKRVIEQTDRIAVMTAEDTQQVENKFNELMQDFLPGMPLFEEWKVNRIDYCINVHTEYASEYIKLLQKGNLPYKTKIPADQNRNRNFKTGSYYVVSTARSRITKKTGSITINFYDKYSELLNQKETDSTITQEIIEQGKNILRLEVQCHKPKTEYLKVKHRMTSKNIHYFLNPIIGYDVIEKAILQICGTADYQRISVAESIINESKYTISKKKQLKKLIRNVAVKHKLAVMQTRNEYISAGTMTQATFRSYIKCLEELNINPVTISDNKRLWNKTYKEGLISIWELFHDAFNKELEDDSESLYVFESDVEIV